MYRLPAVTAFGRHLTYVQALRFHLSFSFIPGLGNIKKEEGKNDLFKIFFPSSFLILPYIHLQPVSFSAGWYRVPSLCFVTQYQPNVRLIYPLPVLLSCRILFFFFLLKYFLTAIQPSFRPSPPPLTTGQRDDEVFVPTATNSRTDSAFWAVGIHIVSSLCPVVKGRPLRGGSHSSGSES